DLVRAMGKLFGWMNYHFFTGHNHIKASELNKIHSSKAYQVLIKHHPEYRLYLETLYDTSDHSNLQVKIKY
ncbi:MAG: metallophosphoesterase, partial [Lactobacillus sp.]|nr:metallophosphoesterase [Lactobacillus sp.]